MGCTECNEECQSVVEDHPITTDKKDDDATKTKLQSSTEGNEGITKTISTFDMDIDDNNNSRLDSIHRSHSSFICPLNDNSMVGNNFFKHY